MIIKETTIVERNERGRVTRHIVSVETRETYRDYDYDLDTRRGEGRMHGGFMDRIMEAYKEDLMSRMFD